MRRQPRMPRTVFYDALGRRFQRLFEPGETVATADTMTFRVTFQRTLTNSNERLQFAEGYPISVYTSNKLKRLAMVIGPRCVRIKNTGRVAEIECTVVVSASS
eukprot:1732427-Rhodomonas_salina.2